MKVSTKNLWRYAQDCLCEYFGCDCRPNTITAMQARRFEKSLFARERPAFCRVGKILSICRQIFKEMRNQGIVFENPFATPCRSRKRVYVNESTVGHILEDGIFLEMNPVVRKVREKDGRKAARKRDPDEFILPDIDRKISGEQAVFHDEFEKDSVEGRGLKKQLYDHEWRLMIALSRFCGLRVPTEVLALTWNCIHLDEMTIHVPATSENSGRKVPIFAKNRLVLNMLAQVFEAVRPEEPSAYLFTQLREEYGNGVGVEKMNRRLSNIVDRIGEFSWKGGFLDLRWSLEKDLALTRKFDPHVIAYWLGHEHAFAGNHKELPKKSDYLKALAGNLFKSNSPVNESEILILPDFLQKRGSGGKR